ncbi:MAG: hypothetical protein IM638_06365 [Bacteroidetes bacterium]|nr:hypothetical protein [Bacteroidota bacterium]
MGYCLFITRKENWFDPETVNSITAKEWINVFLNDKELKPDLSGKESAKDRPPLPDGKEFVFWKNPEADDSGDEAGMYYGDGNIECKNPHDAMIIKLVRIAEKLGAKVQGEECEIYALDGEGRLISYPALQNERDAHKNSKPWWKFW